MNGAMQDVLELTIQCAFTKRVRSLNVVKLELQELQTRYNKT